MITVGSQTAARMLLDGGQVFAVVSHVVDRVLLGGCYGN